MSILFHGAGSGDRLNSANLDSPPDRLHFTWMWWFNYVSFTDDAAWASFVSLLGGRGPCVQLYMNSAVLTIGESINNTYNGPSTLSEGRWYHVAWVRNGIQDNRLFLDGAIEIWDTTAEINDGTDEGLQINDQQSSGLHTHSYMASMKLWDGVLLSQQEVIREMRSAVPVRRKNLWGWWPLHNIGNVRDYFGNHHFDVASAPGSGPVAPTPLEIVKPKLWWFGAPTNVNINESITLAKSNGLTTEEYKTGTVIDQEVAVGTDDGYSELGIFYNNGATCLIGKSEKAFFRWDGITIPAGATIQTCRVRFKSASGSGGGLSTRCYFVDEDDPAAPTNNTELEADPLTNTYVDWAVGGWNGGDWYDTPELKTALQEVIDRAGWISGQAIMLRVDDNITEGVATHDCGAYEWDPANAAWIYIDYIAETGPIEESVTLGRSANISVITNVNENESTTLVRLDAISATLPVSGIRRPVTITGSTGGAQTNYPVRVEVTYDSDMQADFSDVDFRTDDEDAPDLLANNSPRLTIPTQGYLAENIVYDDVTAKYWWIFEDRTSTNPVARLASADTIDGQWTVETSAVISESNHKICSPFIAKFAGSWYIYYGRDDPGNIYFQKSSTVNSGYSTSGLTNPIIDVGGAGTWEAGRVMEPHVILVDSTYYMFYMGETTGTYLEKTGYATSSSPEGPFTKYASNPVLSGDTGSWDAGQDKAADPFVFEKDGVYYIGVAASASGKSNWQTGFFTTTDFVTFTPVSGNPILKLGSSTFGFDNSGAWRGAVTKVGNKYYFAYAGNGTAGYHCLLTTLHMQKGSLNYWLESKVDSTSAIFWVKIPSIPASPDTTIIYMYYGDTSIPMISDGYDTFTFFDDFNWGTIVDQSRWEGTGTQSGGIFSVANSNEATTDFLFGQGYASRTRGRLSSTSGVYSFLGFRQGVFGVEFTEFIANYPTDGFLGSYQHLTADEYSGDLADPGAYHIYEIYRNANTSCIYSIDDSVVSTLSVQVPDDNLPIFFRNDVLVDWVVVREYINPEPSVSVGEEEGEAGGIEESVSLGITLRVTQRLPSNIEENVNLNRTNGILNSVQSYQEDTVSLNRILGESGISNTNESDITTLTISQTITSATQTNQNDFIDLGRFNVIEELDLTNQLDTVSLGRLDNITPVTQTIENDAIILADFINIAVLEEAQGQVNETVILARSLALEVLQEGISHVTEDVVLDRLAVLNEVTQLQANDSTILNRLTGITEVTQLQANDSTILNRLNAIFNNTECQVNDNFSLTKFIRITITEETIGQYSETVTLERFVNLEVLQEGISHVTEDVVLDRLAVINETSQCLVNDVLILNQLVGVTEVEQELINEVSTLTRFITIVVLQEGISHVSETLSLNRLNTISEIGQDFINEIATLRRSNIIEVLQEGISHVSEDVVLDRLIAINEITQLQANNVTILNRLNAIFNSTQCQVNDSYSLAKFVRITIVDETIGQYTEIVTLERFVGLEVLQEGISHVNESLGLSRSNIININEQLKIYNSLIFGRLNGISVIPQSRVFNSLVFSKSDGLNRNAQSLVNENITANKFSGLSSSSQIIVPELINLSQLYSLGILDSRYLLESIDLQYANGLSLIDSPTIFEEIELGRIDIVTIITMLFGYNNINLDQYKVIIAEPPSLYVYNDGNHSVGVLFRDKRAEVLFRDKRASVHWRDKRGG